MKHLPHDAQARFTSVLLHELQSMPDDQVLDGERAEDVLARGQALLAAALCEARRRGAATASCA